ncbi:F0F1 ATP synthase subunit delta [Dongia rigui]|uniref:ATP synthase subunit delta n=1 Tax=Dongia rigui TaxID=940149 RepID=A0ABU5E0D0_9PROT|nr:F0F1 ATP synthase subunit delta [Dongia rigui]MDY0872343.1 F0F1 ATP synthase subunit delta [Dongia rigui]
MGAGIVAAQGSDKGSTAYGGLAQRYAAALFELADSKHQLDAVVGDLAALAKMIDESADFRRLINSPVLSRGDQGRAISGIVQAAQFGPLTAKFLGLLAQNRRLFALSAMIQAFKKMLADRRGEMTAQVWSARPLSADQQNALAETIKRAHGAKVTMEVKVDPALIGGLVVKVGSRMIDSSIRTKLQKLQLAMKGVG